MSVTIDEVARRAQVSRSTVSRALRNSALISEATRERVWRVAQELGYVPNYVAQSLSLNRTNTIGMVITHSANPFIWQVIEGVELTAYERGFSLILSTARNDREREYAVMQSFQRRRVDGIIVSSSHMKTIYSRAQQSIEIPVILINEQVAHAAFRSVSIDDYEGARLAAQHLVNSGHQRIGYIACTDRPRSSEKRYRAYCDVLVEAGLKPLPELRMRETTLHDFEIGFASAESVVQSGVTAAFCYNDRIAVGLQAGLRKLGVPVPDALSVVGFDDIDEAQYAIPALTTVRQPKLQMGRRAVEMLASILNAENVENEILDCELVVRDSTKRLQH